MIDYVLDGTLSMKTRFNSLVASLLQDQYLISEEASERVWRLAQDRTEVSDFTRARADDEDIAVEASELQNDALDFFFSNRSSMIRDYSAELRSRIGQAAQEEFCELLATSWHSSHDGNEFQPLKASIRDYLSVESDGSQPLVNTRHLLRNSHSCYDVLQIGHILDATQYTLHKYIHQWLDVHPRGRFLGLSAVYFRRGVALSKAPQDGAVFIEHDYLNSYSLSLTTAEKFARSSNGYTPAPTVLHCEHSTIEGRAIFFSPFIEGMSIDQLELVAIPPTRPQRIRRMPAYGGTHDYLVLPAADWEQS